MFAALELVADRRSQPKTVDSDAKCNTFDCFASLAKREPVRVKTPL